MTNKKIPWLFQVLHDLGNPVYQPLASLQYVTYVFLLVVRMQTKKKKKPLKVCGPWMDTSCPGVPRTVRSENALCQRETVAKK